MLGEGTRVSEFVFLRIQIDKKMGRGGGGWGTAGVSEFFLP